jgi:hypothetical protein
MKIHAINQIMYLRWSLHQANSEPKARSKLEGGPPQRYLVSYFPHFIFYIYLTSKKSKNLKIQKNEI